MGFVTTWSDESVAVLKGLWGTKPASAIARQMGINKNQVIGKAHRLHLHRVTPGAMWSMIHPRNGKPRPALPYVRPQPKKVKPKVKPMLTLELEMKLISIVELNENTCHWPVGDPTDWDKFRYCGLHKASEAGPYCPHHYTRSMKQFEAVFCNAA